MEDWPVHGLLCDSFATLSRPLGDLKLGLFLPEDKLLPKWVWIPQKLRRGMHSERFEADITWTEMLGPPEYPSGSSKHVTLGGSAAYKQDRVVKHAKSGQRLRRDLEFSFPAFTWAQTVNLSIINASNNGRTATAFLGDVLVEVDAPEEPEETGNPHAYDLTMDEVRIFLDHIRPLTRKRQLPSTLPKQCVTLD